MPMEGIRFHNPHLFEAVKPEHQKQKHAKWKSVIDCQHLHGGELRSPQVHPSQCVHGESDFIPQGALEKQKGRRGRLQLRRGKCNEQVEWTGIELVNNCDVVASI